MNHPVCRASENPIGGAVSAATREATQVGEGILAEGGNAFDAAVASAIALAVTEPGNSGLGGEGYCVFYDAQTAQTGSLCFMSVPGELAAPQNLVGKDRVRGVMASLVPSAVAGWFALISEKCSRSAEELIAPAIRLAEEGYEIGGEAGAFNWMADQFHPSARDIFVRPDRPWEPGDRLVQTDLARTLRLIAKDGQQAFYHGEFAERMDRFYRETDGILRKRDLAAYKPLWQKTLSRSFGDVEVHVPPPESNGFAFLFGLEMLARLGYGSMSPVPAARTMVSVLGEMEQCADNFAARLRPYDPRVDEETARLFEDGALTDAVQRLGQEVVGCRAYRGAHTTSMSACDSSGSLVCITQTLDHGFGSGVVIPGTGVLMNDAMAWVNADPASGRADLVAPHESQLVPVIPTVVLSSSGKPLFALGTPGGYGIPQTTLQVYANILFHKDDLQAAIDKPRVILGALIPEEAHNRNVRLEPGFAPEVYDDLQPAKYDGFEYFGRFHAVQMTPDGDVAAFNDPREQE